VESHPDYTCIYTYHGVLFEQVENFKYLVITKINVEARIIAAESNRLPSLWCPQHPKTPQ